MARGTQPPPRTRSIITPVPIITIIVTLLLATSLASLPVPADSREFPQGCGLHPQEKLVSCRGVNTTLLQEFLQQVITPTTSVTTITTTPNDTSFTTTTTTPPSPDNPSITTANNTTATPLHATDNSTFAATESEDVDGNTRDNSGAQRRDSSGITELSCVGCRVPALTATLLRTPTLPTALERLTIVDSGLEKVPPDALASHSLTLVHLDLSYNLLQTVPVAVVSLTRLQVLDLRHNEIHRVVAGTVLTSLRGLRHLYLDHNQLGQTLSSSQGQKPRPSVFDLWTTADTAPLPRLSHLGLSVNGIQEVPSGAFSRLFSLLHLDLSDNLLTSLRQSDLPASVLNLDLGGNPWNCTCEATWILKRHGSHTSATTSATAPSPTIATTVPSTTIIFPTCFSPLHLRRRRLDLLTASEVCPSEEEEIGDQVVYIGDDVEGPLRDAFRALRLLNATSLTTHALLISWRVDSAFYSFSDPPLQPLSWAVTVRDVTQDPREAHVTRLRLEKYRREQPQWTPSDGLFAEVLEGLNTDTAYIICLTVMQQRRLYTRPGHCLHGTTLSTPPPAPPAATTPEALQSYSTRDYDIRTEAFAVWSEPRSASLSWNVTVLPRKGRSGALVLNENLLLRPIGWRVSFRRSEEEEEDEEAEEVVLVSRGGEPLQNFTNRYSIDGLEAGARYVFCLHTLTDEEVKKSLAGGNSERPLQDASPPQPINSLPWEANSHTLPTTARGRSVVDSRGDLSHQDLETHNNALPAVLPPQHTDKTVTPAHSIPDTHTPVPPPRGDPPFTIPATPSSQGLVHSFPPQPPSTSASSNFPPVPPSLPPLPHSRPTRPPRPQSGGGFVYTSTGKRIPLPSGPSGLLPPFSVPPPTPIRDPGPPRSFPSPSASQPPSRQRFIYEYEETSSVPPPPPLSGSRKQIYTYQTRRRRAVEGRRSSSFKATPLCRQVVTPAELDVVLPAAIAATISSAATVVVVLLVCCCCWPRRCCRRKGAWRSRSAHDSRKVSTISAPSPVTVFSGHTSVVAGTGTGRNDGDATASTREVPGASDRAGRSVSTTSSSGYLTPLHSPDNRGPQNQNPDPKAAYLSLMQSRLLQRHKDLPEFHPGYDIPPTASNKTLVGYDYPHPTPVNSIDGGGEKSRHLATSSPQLPSPSSSDSNYNVSIGNNPEPDRNPTEVNLNIPCHQLKSSGLTKSVHIPPDVTDNSNYIYTSEEAPTTTAARTYLKNPPSKTRHRRFGQPQQGAEEHNSILQSLSRSTPDLVTATVPTEEEGGSAPLNLSLRNDPSHTASSLGQPASLPAASIVESTGYVNFPTVQEDTDLRKQQGQPVNGGSSSNKERETYHTWAGHTAKPRPGVGEVVLSGGTLIEVPEGYVVPKPPKPTPFIRLLVRGQDEPKDLSLKTPPLHPAHEDGGDAPSPAQGTSVTRFLMPETDHNRLVINTAVAL